MNWCCRVASSSFWMNSTQSACRNPTATRDHMKACEVLAEAVDRLAGAHFLRFRILQPPFKRFGHGRRNYSPHGNCPATAKSGLFSEACLLLCHWFPPSPAIPQGNGGRSSDLWVQLLPLPAAPDSGQATVPARVLLGSPPPGLAFVLLPHPSGQTLQPSDGGEGASSLWCRPPLVRWREEVSSLWCCRPLWSDGREGLFSLVLQAPFGLPLGVPSLAPSALHRILLASSSTQQMP